MKETNIRSKSSASRSIWVHPPTFLAISTKKKYW